MGRKLKILVVDDVPAVRTIIRNMLRDAGHEDVIEAEDGDSAWDHLRASLGGGTQPIDLVISDWKMPGLTGIDLLRAVRGSASTREIPFLLVTAEGDPSHLSEALEAGATDYVVKPFNSSELARKIQGLTGYRE